MNRKSILYISSRPPYHSAGLANDEIKILERIGYKVDFLTLYPFIGQKKNQYNVLPLPLSLFFKQLKEKYPWLTLFRKLYHKLIYRFLPSSSKFKNFIVHDNILITCKNESTPPVDVEKILKVIRKKYDYIVILYWQDMITAATLEAIYKKTQAPIICCVVDQYAYTGNCYYPSYCKEYRNECVKCPVFEKTKNPEQAHLNFVYKKHIYESIPCKFIANSYVKKFILETGIVSEDQIILRSFTLDTNIFTPHDVFQSRRTFNIPKDKSFIMLMRYINPYSVGGSRKGILNAIEAIKLFTSTLSQEERDRILLLLIGDEQILEDVKERISVDIKTLGYLNGDMLIDAYSASSVFLSPTIDDTGPSMVNQAMACGTPVVSFEIGTAIDVVKNGETGYMAKYVDNSDFAYGISSVYNLSEIEYKKMRISTRNMALEKNSIQSAEAICRKIFSDLENS